MFVARAPRNDNPLSLSQRSNNLQFSRPSYFQPPGYSRSVYSLDSDPRYLPTEVRRPLKKHQPHPPANSECNTSPEVPANSAHVQRTISSLITPYFTPKPTRRASKSAHNSRRLSSSASSIHSTTSSVLSRKRKCYYGHPKLQTMPSEILDEIFQYLGQETLLALTKVSRQMLDEAANTLYARPSFASTYRLAQFVSVISQNPFLARMVRVLDLSNLGSCVEPGVPLAGWREWKFRSSPLYTIHRGDLGRRDKSGFREIDPIVGRTGSHPLPSPFLKQYSTSRDVPIGGILHILRACPHIQKLNLSNVLLAPDYSVLKTKTSTYKPVAFTELLFVSDVPKSFTWEVNDTRPLRTSIDLVEAILSLKCLGILKIKGGLWVTRDVARRIVGECKKLEKVDFRECGMNKDNSWAIKGQKDGVKAIMQGELDSELRKRQKALSVAVA